MLRLGRCVRAIGCWVTRRCTIGRHVMPMTGKVDGGLHQLLGYRSFGVYVRMGGEAITKCIGTCT